MKCNYPKCVEELEYWGATEAERDTGAKAMPPGWYCPNGHFFEDAKLDMEDRPNPRELAIEIYGDDPPLVLLGPGGDFTRRWPQTGATR
ncbi:hypothetical protein LCGC14_0568780 [marine sediment metagenome]|uniref:Uncharacterized protein n=1 Tax=marine sediment metagenome TaxID=412755 RepID=A0A0F9S3J5_9ZZZZ|nr:hypothetical protein [Phycisphaerae bacterium]